MENYITPGEYQEQLTEDNLTRVLRNLNQGIESIAERRPFIKGLLTKYISEKFGPNLIYIQQMQLLESHTDLRTAISPYASVARMNVFATEKNIRDLELFLYTNKLPEANSNLIGFCGELAVFHAIQDLRKNWEIEFSSCIHDMGLNITEDGVEEIPKYDLITGTNRDLAINIKTSLGRYPNRSKIETPAADLAVIELRNFNINKFLGNLLHAKKWKQMPKVTKSVVDALKICKQLRGNTL